MLFPFHDDNPTTRWPLVTVLLILLNLLSFVFVSQLDDERQLQLLARRGFVPERIQQLFDPQVVEVDFGGRLDPNAANQNGMAAAPPVIKLAPNRGEVILSLFSYQFLHAGWLHLLGNMWLLWLFGNNIEDRLGPIIYLGFYLVGGVVASVCHWIMIPSEAATTPMIGASGAVAVILGAYAVTYPMARVKTILFLLVYVRIIQLPALVVLGFWMFLQFIQAAIPHAGLGAGVAWWAHIGGFVAGLAVMPLLAAGTPEPGQDWVAEAKRQFEFPEGRRDY